MDDLEFFKVNEDGVQTKIDSFEADSTQVYVVVDNLARIIFLWKGIKAPVRLKFIGSRALGDRRKEYGFHYKTDVLDEDDVSDDFRRSMGEEVEVKAKTGFVDDDTSAVPSYAEAAKAQGINVSEAEISEKRGDSTVPSHIGKMGGIGVGPQKSILAAMNDGEIDASAAQKVVTKVETFNLDEAKKVLSELGKPKGFEREMVVVGSKVFRSKGDKEVIFENLDNPLDGLFMVESFTPRLICERGRVIAIELLKRTSEELDADEMAMSQDLEDLTAMFQIEIE